ncbi:MAG: hypothetical protein ACYC91_09655 [Solirubrobacteraceae bacterium]
MTPPAPTSRVLLIADRPSGAASDSGAVRRYRLARVRFTERPRTGEARYEHLKRTYE